MKWLKSRSPVGISGGGSKLEVESSKVLPVKEKEEEETNPFVILSRRLEFYLATSRLGVTLDALNVIFSSLSCSIYVSESYSTHENTALSTLDLVLGIYFILLFLLSLLATKKSLVYLFSFVGIVDVLTLIPVFTYFLGLEANNDGLLDKTTLAYGFISFCRVLRIVRVLNCIRLLRLLASEVEQQIVSLFLTVVSIVFVAAGLIHLVENNRLLWNPHINPFPPYPYGFLFHDVIYLIIMTIATVGYGDVAPKTALGRLFIMLMMCCALILVPKETNKLIAIINTRTTYGRQKYKVDKNIKHVILCGEVSDNIAEFFEEFFHADHGNEGKHVIIISRGIPSVEIQALLRDPRYALQITYLDGNVMDPVDLERACVRTAASIFVLSKKFSSNAGEADAGTILTALSIKRYVYGMTGRDVLTCLQLLKPDSKKLYLSSSSHEGVANYTFYNQIVCVEEFKLNLLAMNCLCPGITTMLGNLMTTISTDGLKFDEPWKEEYADGCGFEIYRVPLSPCFSGITFLDAAQIIYEESGTLLFALNINPHGSAPIIVLNPRDLIIPSCEEYNVFAIVMAEDRDSAEIISKLTNDDATRKAGADEPAILHMERRVAELKINFHAPAPAPAGARERVVSRESMNYVEESEMGGETSMNDSGIHSTAAVPSSIAVPVTRGLRLGSDVASSSERRKNNWMVAKKTIISQHLTEAPMTDEWDYYLEDEPVALESITIHNMDTDLPDVKDHIIICANLATVYHFVSPLRAKRLGQIIPIVIVHTQPPTKVQWQKLSLFSRVFFLQASSLEIESLKKAGIDRASRLVILANEGDSSNYDLVDAHTIFTYRVAAASNLLSEEGSNLHMICELVMKSNTNFLIDLSQKATKKEIEEHQYFSPVYAAGNSFSSGILDTLLCQAYYNPPIISIMQYLVSGVDAGEEADWNIRLGNILNGTRLRSSYVFQLDVPVDFIGRKYIDLFNHMITTHGAIVMGLKRAVNGVLKNTMPYVATNPKGDAIIYAGDKVFLLGGRSLATFNQDHSDKVVIKSHTLSETMNELSARDVLRELAKEVVAGFKHLDEELRDMVGVMNASEGGGGASPTFTEVESTLVEEEDVL